MGEPQNVTEEPIKNVYFDSFKDAIIKYTYPGLKITYYHHRHPENGWRNIIRIEVTGNDYPLKHGIAIGMHCSEICPKFNGYPSYTSENSGLLYRVYMSNDILFKKIILAFKDERLVKYIWSETVE